MWPELIVGLSLSAANFGATFWLWKRSTAYYRDANTKVDAAQQGNSRRQDGIRGEYRGPYRGFRGPSRSVDETERRYIGCPSCGASNGVRQMSGVVNIYRNRVIPVVTSATGIGTAFSQIFVKVYEVNGHPASSNSV